MGKYRKGTCGIFISDSGLILLGERAREPGHWQLPQGGLEGDETPLEGLQREMWEEVGLKDIEVITHTRDYIPYTWPKGLFKSKHKGQKHIYYLLEGNHLNPKKLGPTEEFARFRWHNIEEVLDLVVDWKREAYMTALQELGLI